MDLKSLKENFISMHVQFITIDDTGKTLSSDNALYDLKKNSYLFDLHPFFYAVSSTLSSIKDKIFYPCVNLDIKDTNKILDISVEKISNGFLVSFVDFTDHYTTSHPLVQEKNEASIHKSKLYFEHALLEVKENYKNQFLSQLNHEIRNPLNNFLGFIDVLNETNLDYQQKETINVIKKTGKHIKYLMDDLLDISKIESGKIKIKNVAFNLFHVIKNIKTHFELKGTNSKIIFNVESKKNIPGKLVGDPLRLNQILFNLIDNAFRNTNEGTINVLFDYTLVDKNKIELHVKISDTGIGISKENLDKVFETYFRLQISKVEPIGQGLGLKIVKDLTELLKGKVHVDSEVDKGTQFSISIPFETRNTNSKTKTVPKGSGIVISKRILVVEDEELNQMLYMKNFLNNEKGFHIEISANESDTLKKLEKKSYYAIILKSKLHKDRSHHLIKEIRSSEIKSISEIPILIVTGKTMIEEQEEFLDIGATEFLAKPYNKRDLFKKLEMIHES